MTPAPLARCAFIALFLACAPSAFAQTLMVQPKVENDLGPGAMPAEPSEESASNGRFSSAYTDLDIAQCTNMHADDFGALWACPGYKGIPVRVAEGDLRFMVSFGLESGEERAAEQTLPPFNSLGGKIEWRLANQAGQIKPIAAILRYFFDKGEGGGPEKQSQVLVVTQIEPGATCHIAYIDASANENANELARQEADKAGDFDCSGEPRTIGEFSAW